MAPPDRMDAIEFEAIPKSRRHRSGGIRILINGADLIDLARAHEAPLADAEGSPSIAGEYSGLPPGPATCPPGRHFLGEVSNPTYEYGDKVQVLECECGEPGCWPLVCRITVDRGVVVWSDFEQPYRTGARGRPIWSYAGFGPFRFDRVRYEEALARLAQPPGR